MMKQQKIIYIVIFIFIYLIVDGYGEIATAQTMSNWTPQQRIPGYEDDTEPPILVADQNNTVYAFSSQLFDLPTSQPEIAIIYSQWILDQGWTQPIDILMSPLKQIAQILDVFLDQSGILHIIFYGGDSTNANIYYSTAPAINAGEATAWSDPILIGGMAQSPGSAAIVGDNNGNLIVVYGGIQDGNGVYVTSTNDNGSSWSNPRPIFLAPNNQPIISGVKVNIGPSGWLHAIWNVLNVAGQGRSINYARTKIGEAQWSEPVDLAEASTGYGILTPAIIEYKDSVFAFYNVNAKIVVRRSKDGGQTWSDPVTPFVNFTGVNGSLSLVVDGNHDLHLFFGQRIPGKIDIHGLWHSVWGRDTWSVPEPVVSGPRNMSGGDRAFDPFNARAVVSQGNIILVTWRTDPGNGVKNENGVWYSYKDTGAKALPVNQLPSLQQTPTIIPAQQLRNNPGTPELVNENSILSPADRNINNSLVNNLHNSTGPLSALVFGIIPAVLVIFGIIFGLRRFHR
jgi:hypothetical protein